MATNYEQTFVVVVGGGDGGGGVEIVRSLAAEAGSICSSH